MYQEAIQVHYLCMHLYREIMKEVSTHLAILHAQVLSQRCIYNNWGEQNQAPTSDADGVGQCVCRGMTRHFCVCSCFT